MATIAVDFDGTIVTHEYPKIGTELPFATETLKMLIRPPQAYSMERTRRKAPGRGSRMV